MHTIRYQVVHVFLTFLQSNAATTKTTMTKTVTAASVRIAIRFRFIQHYLNLFRFFFPSNMQSEPNTHNFQTNCSINSRTIVILGVCLWALLLYCSNERHEYEVFRINSSIRLKWSNFSKSIRKSFSENCIAFLSRLHKPCNISFPFSRSLSFSIAN